MEPRRRHGVRGAGLALLAAACFGASTPLVRVAGEAAGPWTTAGLLYSGAALVSFFLRQHRKREAPLAWKHAPTLLLAALFGAALAPAALAWGLQRTSALSASLLLNAEAVFTILLAAVAWREHVGLRVGTAAAILALGGTILVLGHAPGGRSDLFGMLAVLAATAGWAVDNVVSRPLADVDPGAVVLAKSLVGAVVSLAAGALSGETGLGASGGFMLLAIGAGGYGLSMRFYLLAQRSFGTARTTAAFATAPFLGALLAVAMGDRPGLVTLAASALAAAGVLLLVTERHYHPHFHAALEHEHAHRHDAEHHAHAGEGHPPGKGSHSHVHRHEPATHAHPHGPDQHHGHPHG
ncbi:MAG TPA: EamA family transporter [Candidatus Deferrimicrobiaceae bacterium]